MERVERENLRNEARRPVRKQYLYADANQIHVNLAANQQPVIREVEGARMRLGVNPGHTDWRMIHRKPFDPTAFQEGEDPVAYYAREAQRLGVGSDLQRQRERRIQDKPVTFTAALPDYVAPGEEAAYMAAQLHAQRMANVRASPQTPAEKKEKRRRRKDPLFTSVHYPGDNPRK